ncbi:FMN-binding negative transcriptional regulator [Croceicoccus ponticola]|nr:FMN-binding negative transcriptional regulator [Croceicoccus ponticola]
MATVENSNVDAGSTFERFTPGDVRLLIETYPLAWLEGMDRGRGAMLPLIGVFDTNDILVELIGHFPRSHDLHDALTHNGAAVARFCGPQGYVSPSNAGRRDWAPTWNFCFVEAVLAVEVSDAFTDTALDTLVDHMEADRTSPWRKEELGERLPRMRERIVGFRARVESIRGRFKLGQDETVADLQHIMNSLANDDLAFWMRRMNRNRLPGADA